MKIIRLLSILLLSIHTLASAAPATPVIEKEGVARDQTGRTLYVFAHDKPGTSKCTDDCNKSWPAFIAPAGAKPTAELSLVAREGGVWHAARTEAVAPAASAPAAAPGYNY